MAGLTEIEVRERLKKVNASMESVQGTTAWMMENKEHIDVITQAWMDVYSKGSESLRIALIYVVNDVVQCAKRDRDKSVAVAFHPHFVNAIVKASETVRKPISRCLQVFRERHIYPKHHVSDGNPEDTMDEDGDFELDAFLKSLETYSESSAAIDQAQVVLDRIDFELDENAANMTDRTSLIQMEDEVDLMIKKLETFLDRIQRHNQKSTKLEASIVKSRTFFHTQLKDVAMVHDAYDRYARGIADRISQLEPIVRSGILPGQTPPRDVPSPKPGEDPFAGIGEDSGDDMDIEDDDRPANKSTSSLIPPKDFAPSRPSGLAPNPADPRAARFPQAPPSLPNNNLPGLPPLPPGLAEMLPNYPPPNIPPPGIAMIPHQVPAGAQEYSPISHVPPGEVDVDLRNRTDFSVPPPAAGTFPGPAFPAGNFSTPPPNAAFAPDSAPPYTAGPPPRPAFTPINADMVRAPMFEPQPNNGNFFPPGRNGGFPRRGFHDDYGGPRKKFRRGSFQPR